MEKYLAENTEEYIDSIGRNVWISLFTEKIHHQVSLVIICEKFTSFSFNLFQVKDKCRSKRNDYAAAVRNALFSMFGEEKLSRVDNNTASIHLAEWKQSEKTRNAYDELFNNNQLLSDIGYVVFKKYKGKMLPKMHCAFVLAISDILLNPLNPNIKCKDKSVARRVHAFLVILSSNCFKFLILIFNLYSPASSRK